MPSMQQVSSWVRRYFVSRRDLKELTDNWFTLVDGGDKARKGEFQLSGITTGNTRTLTWPDASGTIAIASGAGTHHGGLDGLGDDDHSQYALLAGRGAETLIISNLQVAVSGVGGVVTYIKGAIVGTKVYPLAAASITRGVGWDGYVADTADTIGVESLNRNSLASVTNTANLVATGGNFLVAKWESDGSLSIQRTGGSLTYEIAMNIYYI